MKVNEFAPMVELRNLIYLDLDKVQVNPLMTYEMVGVYSFGRGLFDREPVQGNSTSYKHFYRLKPEHIVMSQLFGWEGALALSSPQFAGKYVSPQFPTFRVQLDRLDRDYLGWYIRRPAFWNELGAKTKGMGDRRRTLNPEALLSCFIPLPSLSEQRRIVEKIERLAGKIEEARQLFTVEHKQLEQVVVSMAHRADISREEKLRAGWREIRLDEILRVARNPVEVEPDKTYPNLGIFSFGKGLFLKAPIEGAATSATTLYQVRGGQFIYSRLFAFEGAYARTSSEHNGYFVSNEFPTFDCNPEFVNVDFLWAYFRSPKVWIEVAAGSKGIGHRRQRIHPEHILSYQILLPPIDWQYRISKIQAEFDRLKDLRKQNIAKLDVLLPSILDKAFKGEL